MTHDPTYLGAAETGYDEGYNDALIGVRRILHGPGIDAGTAVAIESALDDDGHDNPYERLRSDRRAYVREQVVDTFGSFYNDDGDDVLFDGEMELIDAILDAHADWMIAHQPGDSAAETLLQYVTTALVHTVEYVGPDMLPAIPGWSWFDALSKVAPDHELLTRHATGETTHGDN